tara:strand:+ start:158 stop:1084 length:927 start_codon:yes stop_codon:yes gene_type:complete
MKKRGRKKKTDTENASSNNIIHSVDLQNKASQQTKISFGDKKKPAYESDDTKRNLSFGGLNITVHSAKKTDISQVSKMLRFGSTTADRDNRNTTGEQIEYGRVVEKNKTVRSMPSRMCEIVEHNSDDNEEKKEPEPTPYNRMSLISSLSKPHTREKHKSDKLNNLFEQNGGMELPKKTNLHCWWCFHSFTCSPCFLPTVRDDYRNRFVVIGNFCSWNCVKAYNIDQGDSQISKRNDIIRHILKKLDIQPEKIKPAPPRNALKEMGGPLDINVFRKSGGIYSQNKNLSSLTIVIEPSQIIKKKEKLSIR